MLITVLGLILVLVWIWSHSGFRNSSWSHRWTAAASPDDDVQLRPSSPALSTQSLLKHEYKYRNANLFLAAYQYEVVLLRAWRDVIAFNRMFPTQRILWEAETTFSSRLLLFLENISHPLISNPKKTLPTIYKRWQFQFSHWQQHLTVETIISAQRNRNRSTTNCKMFLMYHVYEPSHDSSDMLWI